MATEPNEDAGPAGDDDEPRERRRPAAPVEVDTALVGGGPAMLGLLTAARRAGALERLAAAGLCVVDSGSPEAFGAGRLGDYLVRSDTRARVFAECAQPVLAGAGPFAEGVLASCESDEPVPLDVAARLLGYAGSRLLDGLRGLPGVQLLQDRLVGLQAGPGPARLRLAGGGQILARQVVLALGGWPWLPPELAGSDVLHSDEVLRSDGYADLLAALPADDPRVTIIGGAHSAFAVAGLLLRAPVNWAPAAITVAHRSRIRVTYPDAATARADGRLVRPDDICPATGMVDRFGGLRADAAQLYQRVRRRQEPRVRLVRSASTDRVQLPTADVVVAATGYTSAVQTLWPGADWDGEGRLLDPAGAVVPRVYGLGLGTRRPRSERTGGEPAFHGAIDGAWFYQNIVAPQVLQQLT